MKNQKVNPLEVTVVDNKLVLTRNVVVTKSEEIGTFTDRKELGNKVRAMGFNKVKFSQEALQLIDADIAKIKAEKAEIRNAKKLERAESKAIKQAERVAKAEARTFARALKAEAKVAKAAEREQRKADKATAKLARAEARVNARIAKDAVRAEKAAAKAAKVEAKLAKRKPSIVNSKPVERVEARMAA